MQTCFEGPFGEVVRKTGDLANANPFRFSTKYQDEETGLLYYTFRYYNASTGRWSSRDPLGEAGSVNLFAFLANESSTSIEFLGLVKIKKGDKLDVTYQGKKVGHVTIKIYRTYNQGKDQKGAWLQIEPVIDDCWCGVFQWRQKYTATADGKYVASKGGKYYKGNGIAHDQLDVDWNNQEAADGEWYYSESEWQAKVAPEACVMDFDDRPQQPDFVSSFPGNDLPMERRVEFSLELVRVANRSQKKGGETVLSIEWGFWFTAKDHKLIEREDSPATTTPPKPKAN